MRKGALILLALLLALFPLCGCLPKEAAPQASAPQAPTIYAPDVTLHVGQPFQAMQGVQALDARDGDITANVQVEDSSVNIKKGGTYQVRYSVTNSAGVTSSAVRTVVVEQRFHFPSALVWLLLGALCIGAGVLLACRRRR
nr:DUF5011 domain-containing protein [Maliibacterium massiliense]